MYKKVLFFIFCIFVSGEINIAGTWIMDIQQNTCLMPYSLELLQNNNLVVVIINDDIDNDAIPLLLQDNSWGFTVESRGKPVICSGTYTSSVFSGTCFGASTFCKLQYNFKKPCPDNYYQNINGFWNKGNTNGTCPFPSELAIFQCSDYARLMSNDLYGDSINATITTNGDITFYYDIFGECNAKYNGQILTGECANHCRGFEYTPN